MEWITCNCGARAPGVDNEMGPDPVGVYYKVGKVGPESNYEGDSSALLLARERLRLHYELEQLELAHRRLNKTMFDRGGERRLCKLLRRLFV